MNARQLVIVLFSLLFMLFVSRRISRFSYEKEFQFSVQDPQGFWRSQLHRVSWFKKPTVILDQSRPPFFRWFPDGEMNLSYNCIDRHLPTLANSVAYHFISPVTHRDQAITYSQLHDQVSRFAWSLKNEVGLKQGDTVIIYMPMVPEAAVAMLACGRIGAIHSVVFGGFAAPELAARIKDANAKAIITCTYGMDGYKKLHYKPIVNEAIGLAEMPSIKTIVYQRDGERVDYTDFDFEELTKKGKSQEAVKLSANHPAYILYTSGTTGSPKGVVRDISGIAMSLNYTLDRILDIGERDVLFSTSDIGWVVGHCFNIYGPLLRGGTAIIYEGKPVSTPDAGALWKIVEEKKVKHVFTAPTAVRVIRKEDINGDFIKKHDIRTLKGFSIAGERCDIPTYTWLRNHLKGVFLNDNFWQTESGYPMISNFLNLTTFPFKPGSATKPVPGFNLVALNDQGEECQVDQLGKICVKYPTPPTFALTLWNKDDQYIEKYFTQFKGYYFTGDAGYRDKDGYYHIMTRLDDVINTAGHRLSTAQMEGIIMTHPSVSEAIVIGVKDDIKGEIPIGLITIRDDDQLDRSHTLISKEIIALVRHEIGPVASFKYCVVVQKLPKTRSGKYLRNVVRAMANHQSYKTPATIEDSSVLQPLEEQINALNLHTQIQYEEDTIKSS